MARLKGPGPGNTWAWIVVLIVVILAVLAILDYTRVLNLGLFHRAYLDTVEVLTC